MTAEMWDPFSPASYGLVGIGSAYPTMSAISQVGTPGRPGLPHLHPDNPMTAFAVILGLTMLGFFAASYNGTLRVGPFRVGGSASAGKK